jgi:hypothetical protein
MKITANETVKDGGSVGQHITYFSVDGENNIAHRVNWFDPEANQIGIISDMKILNHSIGETLATIDVDTMEWGITL